MTPQKVREVLKLYEGVCDDLLRGLSNPEPARIDPSTEMDIIESEHDKRYLKKHLAWMCREAAAFPDEKVEKMMRWLGFIQGCLFCFGVYTLEEMKRHNMPDPGESS